MAIKNTLIGGTDNINGEDIEAVDVNDTNDAIITPFKELFAAKYGESVLSGCEITDQTSPDQTAQMSSGKVLVNGLYYVIAADASFAFTNADGSNPRYDLVSVDSAGTVTVTDGTAAATPAVPTLPTDDVPLAIVYRAASDNTINTADITDCRYMVDETGMKYIGSYNGESTSISINVPPFVIKKYIVIKMNVDITGWSASSPLANWSWSSSATISCQGNSAVNYSKGNLYYNATYKGTILGGGCSVFLRVEDGDGTFDVTNINLVSASCTASVSNGSGETINFRVKSVEVYGV